MPVEAKKVEVKQEVKQEVKPEIKLKLKHKIIGYDNYLFKAGEILEQGGINGMNSKVDIAIALLYEENEVISTVTVKNGVSKYLCKA